MNKQIERKFLKGLNNNNNSFKLEFSINGISFNCEIKRDFINETNKQESTLLFYKSALNECVSLYVDYKAYFKNKNIIKNIGRAIKEGYKKEFKASIKDIILLFNNVDNIKIHNYLIHSKQENLKTYNTYGDFVIIRKELNNLFYWVAIEREKVKVLNNYFFLGSEIIGSEIFKNNNESLEILNNNFYIGKTKASKEVFFKMSLKDIYNFYVNNIFNLDEKKEIIKDIEQGKKSNGISFIYDYRTKEYKFKTLLSGLVYRFEIKKELGNIFNNIFYFGLEIKDNEAIKELIHNKIITLKQYEKNKIKQTLKVSFYDIKNIFVYKDFNYLKNLLKDVNNVY